MAKTLAAGGMQVLKFAVEFAPQSLVSVHCDEKRLQEVQSLFKEFGIRDVPVNATTREKLMALIDSDPEAIVNGVISMVEIPRGVELEELISLDPKGVVLVCDSIQDVHNLGAMSRSALLLGATGVVFQSDRGARLTHGALKASSGTFLLNQFSVVTNISVALRDLKKQGFWIGGLTAEKGTGPQPVSVDKLAEYRPLALVVGSEAEGIRKNVLEQCDFTVTLPLVKEFQSVSLNASVAAALTLDRALRKKL